MTPHQPGIYMLLPKNKNNEEEGEVTQENMSQSMCCYPLMEAYSQRRLSTYYLINHIMNKS